jgi:hypothetical protein
MFLPAVLQVLEFQCVGRFVLLAGLRMPGLQLLQLLPALVQEFRLELFQTNLQNPLRRYRLVQMADLRSALRLLGLHQNPGLLKVQSFLSALPVQCFLTMFHPTALLPVHLLLAPLQTMAEVR